MEIQVFGAGGYRFIPAVFQYSGGVAAEPGFRVERFTFRKPVPLATGLSAESVIKAQGRPLTSFCACELRSPQPFSDQGFREFNELYVQTLTQWGIYDGGINPVARSNVCPEIDPPAEPSFHAFAFTVPANASTPRSSCPAAARRARAGRHTASGRFAMARPTMQRSRKKPCTCLARWSAGSGLGQSWATTTATQVYTVHNLYPFFGQEIVRRGAAHAGLTWHLCRPPVRGLEYEMDCRGISVEHAID